MHSIVALNPGTRNQLGAFLCKDRDKVQTEKWFKSMRDRGAQLRQFKTEQDYIEWLQDRAAGK